jgi:hypothetical protein
MRALISAVILILGLSPILDLNAQPLSEQSYQKFMKDFVVGLRSESNARVKISALKLSPRKATLLLNHYLALANDDDLAAKLFYEVRATGLIDRIVRNPSSVESESQTMASLGYELFESYSVKGMKRLEYPDVRRYLESIQTMFEVVPPKLCKALLIGEISGQRQETALSAYLLNRMSDAEVESFLRLVRKATLAEVKNFPSVKGVSESQKKLAEDSFMRQFAEDLVKHPRAELLLRAAQNLGDASDRDACDFGRLTIGSILKMQGTVAEWQARAFLESL